MSFLKLCIEILFNGYKNIFKETDLRLSPQQITFSQNKQNLKGNRNEKTASNRAASKEKT